MTFTSIIRKMAFFQWRRKKKVVEMPCEAGIRVFSIAWLRLQYFSVYTFFQSHLFAIRKPPEWPDLNTLADMGAEGIGSVSSGGMSGGTVRAGDSCSSLWENKGRCTAATQPGIYLPCFALFAAKGQLSTEMSRFWGCVIPAQSRRCCRREMPYPPGLLLLCKIPPSWVFATNIGEPPSPLHGRNDPALWPSVQ